MSALFDPGREGFLDGSIDWDTDDVRSMLVRSTYTFDATDKFIADIGAVDNGRSAALGTISVSALQIVQLIGISSAEQVSAAQTALTLRLSGIPSAEYVGTIHIPLGLTRYPRIAIYNR